MAPDDDSDKYLEIYLNDHLGGSTAGIELVKRMRGEYEGTELGDFLQDLTDEIAEDRETLRTMMDAVDADPDRLKVAGGWIGEKLGRLKLNGEVLGRSPLSPFLELESLSLGIEGKRLLWVTMLETHPQRFGGAEKLTALVERAERQRAGVEEQRRLAARRALLAAKV
jgi:hypothetical protein